MLSETMGETRGAAVNADEATRLYASLAEGLHALAQPLTILRASIVAASSAETTQERRTHYLEISKSQVERACELFNQVQELAIAAESRVDRRPYDPGELL